MSKPSLQLKQSQSLVMTNQLRQSIELLQYSSLELHEFIAQELEKNPLLTTEEPELVKPSESEILESPDNAKEENLVQEEIDASSNDIWGGEVESEKHYEKTSSGLGSAHISEIIEQQFTKENSLQDHVLAQILIELTDPAMRSIAYYMVDLLDESGYLRENIDVIAKQLGAEKSQVKEVLKRLQACDPVGVGAHHLTECLTLQLQEKGLLTREMERVLANLDAMTELGIKPLAKRCRVSEAELTEMIQTIRSLDPKPGSHFAHEQVETLVPDILVKRQGKQWRVELNNELLPRLLINRQYHTTLNRQSRDKADKKFLNEQFANASWLLKALDQRAQSMLKVATELVKQQEMFFEHGIRYLRPMTLSQIAEEIELHESTVSRITQGKYIASPRGTFPLKFFFSSSLSDAAAGEGTSSRAVMHMIKELIEAESADKILSDESIAKQLQERGIDVARRTVVKYRQVMHIPSSTERRRAKRRV